MLNHFRTLLLNLSDLGEISEHLLPGCRPVTLSTQLQQVHQLLFPLDSTRQQRMTRALVYEGVLRGCGEAAFITALDPRITYDWEALNNFSTSTVSVPVSSDSSFKLVVQGVGSPGVEDTVQVSQVGYQEVLLVRSLDTNRYYLDKSFTQQADKARRLLQLDAVSGVSNSFGLGGTGLSFTIRGRAFTETGHKTFSFYYKFPEVFDVLAVWKELQASSQSISDLLAMPAGLKTEAGKAATLCLRHHNTLYRFAGLLESYILRVHDLWLRN